MSLELSATSRRGSIQVVHRRTAIQGPRKGKEPRPTPGFMRRHVCVTLAYTWKSTKTGLWWRILYLIKGRTSLNLHQLSRESEFVTITKQRLKCFFIQLQHHLENNLTARLTGLLALCQWCPASLNSVPAELLQSCLTLCDPMDYKLAGSSVHGFSRQEYWSGLPCPQPGDLPGPGIKACPLGLLRLWLDSFHHCHLKSLCTESL